LDSLDLYNPDWWALGKIYAFHIQETPFIHVDGDVFIWEKFPERLEKSGLIAQNLEFGFPIYQEVFTALTQSGSYMPPVILDNYAHNQGFHAYNAGIIGGNDMVFFKEFSTEALLFIERNSGTSELGSGMINAFYEQHLYYCMAKKKGIKVECYTDYTDQDVLNESLKSLRQFSAAPVTTSYIHLFGEDVKKDAGICRELARRLRGRISGALSPCHGDYQEKNKIKSDLTYEWECASDQAVLLPLCRRLCRHLFQMEDSIASFREYAGRGAGRKGRTHRGYALPGCAGYDRGFAATDRG
jgi:hypothetical protein